MQGGIFSYGLVAALAIALLFAAFTDLKRRQIDNWLNAGIALTAPLFWVSTAMSLTDIGWQLAVAGGSFVALLGLFAMNAMGGGDVKLLTALALWLEPTWFLRMLMVMAILGGVLTIMFGVWHITRRRKGRIAIPYGVAISCAALWALAVQYLPAFQPNTSIIGT